MKTLIFLFLFTVSVWSSAVPKVKSSLGGRIINGLPADPTEFPYAAAIWSRTPIARYFCTGSVIDRQWILTAGHCVYEAESFEIRVGSITLTATDSNRQTIFATFSYVHPDFDPDSLSNNIGLIYLEDQLRYNDYVNVIALPTAELAENVVLTSIGWGQIDDDHSGPVETLNRVYVVSLLNEHCKNFYGDQINDNMVCATGSYNEGTCIGDIGGPLIQDEGPGATIVGVASFLSSNGCESLDPSGYERTFQYLDWIKSVTGIP